MKQFVIEPPEPITTFVYRCDSAFYLEPLEEVVADKKSYGLIVIDRNEATVGRLRGKSIHVIKNTQSGVMGKHHKGGQSAVRFERLIEISVHEFFKRIGGIANDAFLDDDDLLGIIIGGPFYSDC